LANLADGAAGAVGRIIHILVTRSSTSRWGDKTRQGSNSTARRRTTSRALTLLGSRISLCSYLGNIGIGWSYRRRRRRRRRS
jgi:cell division protein FtsB